MPIGPLLNQSIDELSGLLPKLRGLSAALERLSVWLIAQGHDACHAFDLGLDRVPDEEILRLARRENQIVVTADLDYPRLLALAAADSPAVILFRGGNYNDSEMVSLLRSVLDAVDPGEISHSFIVADRRRIRKPALPLS